MKDVLVSVVIPTYYRPELLSRAVRSVLAQTLLLLEVIVVVDGPDPETVVALHALEDARIKIIELPASVGGAEARNVGVRAANGYYIALLDDDDEWHPDKLRLQVECAAKLERPVISSRVIARTPAGDLVWPRRLYTEGEDVGDYLLSRDGALYGERLMQTSSLLTTRALLLEVPFRKGLRRHQDLDWLIRVARTRHVVIRQLPEPLAIWHIGDARSSVSRAAGWRVSYEWLLSIRPHITQRAYLGFIVTQIAPFAAREKDIRSFFQFALELLRKRATFNDMVTYMLMWCVPQRVRHRVRDLLASKRRAQV